ncbi:MAG: hypothetical protein FWF71_00290 [Actinomycetia bacterium]|nr:hypothetical protein [Actinomycetes bacterium]
MSLKITKKTLPDGIIEMQVTAPPQAVGGIISTLNYQLAAGYNIHADEPAELVKQIMDKIGGAPYTSFMEANLHQYLANAAVDQERLEIVMAPEVSTAANLVPGQDLNLTVRVTPKPHYEVSSYDPVSIKVPRVSVSEAEVDEQLLRLAESRASCERLADRPLAFGDSILIALNTKDSQGEQIDELTSDRYQYQLGQGFLPAQFDQEILGMNVGESRSFEVALPGSEAAVDSGGDGKEAVGNGSPAATAPEKLSFTVELLELQKRVIPAVTDIWVEKTFPGMRSVPELRDAIRRQGLAAREQEIKDMSMYLAASEFAQRFEGSIPDKFHEFTRGELLAQLQDGLDARNMSLEEHAASQGMTVEQFNTRMMTQIRETSKQGFCLDALARHLELEITDEDIETVFGQMAPDHEQEARQEFEATGRMYLIREAAMRNKANKWLVDTAKIEYLE